MNFNQDNYTVDESDGQVSVSLHIDGKFFYPVWAIIAISGGTATGVLCLIKCLDTWTPNSHMHTYSYSIVFTDLLAL